MWAKPQHNATVTITIMAITPELPDFCRTDAATISAILIANRSASEQNCSFQFVILPSKRRQAGRCIFWLKHRKPHEWRDASRSGSILSSTGRADPAATAQARDGSRANHARPLGERARDGDALRFTSGEHASALFGKIGETDIG
jgi:hypothetical protein